MVICQDPSLYVAWNWSKSFWWVVVVVVVVCKPILVFSFDFGQAEQQVTNNK